MIILIGPSDGGTHRAAIMQAYLIASNAPGATTLVYDDTSGTATSTNMNWGEAPTIPLSYAEWSEPAARPLTVAPTQAENLWCPNIGMFGHSQYRLPPPREKAGPLTGAPRAPPHLGDRGHEVMCASAR